MTGKKTNHVNRSRRVADEVVSLADRVAKSRAALEKRGGARIPTGWLQPDAAKALHYLQAHDYASNRVGCISRALTEAAATARKHAAKSRKNP